MATLLSLFDGSGGFPLAAAMCGITPIAASEVEPYPIAVTKSRFPTMRHLGDVSKIDGGKIEPVDIITFGSPCQDMSVAGKRTGIKHKGKGDEETTRSGLFMEAVRIIKEMREATNGRYPAFAVWENVHGAFSSNKGEDFRLVLDELIKIVEPEAPPVPMPDKGWPYADIYMGNGWSIAYRTFDARYWGVPQKRRRIYLVADFGGRRAAEILFKREGLRGHFTEGGTPRKGTSADVAGGAGIHDSKVIAFIGCVIRTAGFKAGQGAQARGIGWEEEKTPTLAAEAGGNSIPSVCVAYDARGNGNGEIAATITGDHENRITDYTTIVCLQGNIVDRNAKQNGCGVCENISHTLNAVDHHAVAYAIGNGQAHQLSCVNQVGALDCMHDQKCVLVPAPKVFGVNCRNGKEYADLYPTLQAKPNGGQSLNFSGAVRVQHIVRRLTPTECARLQGFPDLWGHLDKLEDMTDEDYAFWLEVRNTNAAINGKAVKQYTKAQMLKWYNGLHTDSAEYKMWGNGIALPCALYVMQGIEEVHNG